VVAILLVGWPRPVPLSDDTRAAMSLMAIEASVAVEQADLLRTVQELARTDQLTGIPNGPADTRAARRRSVLHREILRSQPPALRGLSLATHRTRSARAACARLRTGGAWQ
jgi:hypothetical protein